jgi:N-methylhydantoinase A
LHGTTVATNAILERKGAVTSLITTKGFRDVIEMGTGRRPNVYDLLWKKPEPLVPRRFRYELSQRITADVDLNPAFDSSDLGAVTHQMQAAGIDSTAICLMGCRQIIADGEPPHHR